VDFFGPIKFFLDNPPSGIISFHVTETKPSLSTKTEEYNMNSIVRKNSTMFPEMPFFPNLRTFMFPDFQTRDLLPVQQDEEGNYVLVADVPGFGKDDLDIRFDNGCVKIKGVVEVGMRKRQVDKVYTLPRNAGVDDAKAVLENGVLTITFPQVETGKTIPIALIE
jgi:HSP20 family protein